jgi:hypothetical protein
MQAVTLLVQEQADWVQAAVVDLFQQVQMVQEQQAGLAVTAAVAAAAEQLAA